MKVRSRESVTWTCVMCGADNEDSVRFCDACGELRPDGLDIPKGPEDDETETKAPLREQSPPPADVDEAWKGLQEELREEQPEIAPEIAPEIPPETEPDVAPEIGPEPAPEITADVAASVPATKPTGQARWYLVFVNSPAQSLIKSKVPIEFDLFPVITIGRSPENILVIPDQEVSRKHAELTVEGTRVVLKDLNSKNGTYVYNGKEFERVSDSVEVKPNSILKFGTGTIVRLTSE